MDFDHDNVRLVVDEDRLSSLPDELIHKILSCLDAKFSVQTCLLSPRWKFVWTSIPCLNFSSSRFDSLPKFAQFVKHFLSRRNHQTEVFSVKLYFHGATSQVFVRKIASYALSHNVQELTVLCWPKHNSEFPPCLFRSQSLKHFSLSGDFHAPCCTPKTPWDFPALTSLHLHAITLCYDNSQRSLDLFSKCVNLENLTLEWFIVNDVEVIDIISPRLSNIMLLHVSCAKGINLIAPQLENLTAIDCSIKYLNAPHGISSLCYKGYFTQLTNGCFHSLNKATVFFRLYKRDTEEDAHQIINMLQQLHSARFLTLNVDIVECLSSFPDLLSHLPSPFSNLSCLKIDADMRSDVYKVKMPPQARSFLLENSPNATIIMKLPEEPPTKAMKQKEARARKKAKVAADIANIERYMTELLALLEQGKMRTERKQKKKMVEVDFWKHIFELLVLLKQKMVESERVRAHIEQVNEYKAETQMQVDQGKAQIEPGKVLIEEVVQMQVDSHKAEMQLQGQKAHIEREGLQARVKAHFVRVGLWRQAEAFVGVMWALAKQHIELLEVRIAEMQLQGRITSEEIHTGQIAWLGDCLGHMVAFLLQEIEDNESLSSKRADIVLLLEQLPKQQRAKIEACYSRHLEEAQEQRALLELDIMYSHATVENFEKIVSCHIFKSEDVCSSKIRMASQASSSSSGNVPSLSISNVNSMLGRIEDIKYFGDWLMV